ncbi:hypothetical protein [Flavobacterium phragmitis]|uniref:Uncharacterized protein n=1 Tax=Flavobacterium phragmitis TaxID=739143 RepID=A0A1I1RXG2_9FLAO|nr:hypothetical protein [Flavobacterium phragmitis]SFD38787.1 hypothetical protein SAMN05216297_107200 [Flavobacterium phragmitis]
MKKFLRELKIGLIISLAVFVPYLTVVYLFVQWNISQTNNLTENDFSEQKVVVSAIGEMEEQKTENHTTISNVFTLINTNNPKTVWRINSHNDLGITKGDTIEVKFRAKQLQIATDKSFTGKVQQFFSTYGNQVMVYKLSKNKEIKIDKPINEYDDGTSNRGGLFMSAFTLLFIYAFSIIMKKMKAKNLWFT